MQFLQWGKEILLIIRSSSRGMMMMMMMRGEPEDCSFVRDVRWDFQESVLNVFSF
jgi:hypothetical protein